MSIKARALTALPGWCLRLAYLLGSAVKPGLRARTPLTMCTTLDHRRRVGVPPGYEVEEVRAAAPPAGWIETLASAGIAVTSQTWVADFGTFPRARVVAIRHGGAIIATAGVTPLGTADTSTGLLTWVAVRKEHQGRGLARPLIDASLDEAFAVGLTTVVLLTDDHRIPAIRTYLATGFRPCLNTWDWTHRPRWHAIRAALRARVPDCGDRRHAVALAQIRW